MKDEKSADELISKILEIRDKRPKFVKFNKQNGKYISIEYDGNVIKIENVYGDGIDSMIKSVAQTLIPLYDEHIRNYADIYERKF